MIRGRFLVYAVVASLALSAVALFAAGDNLTVGDFAVLVASRVNPEAAAATPAAAADVLRKSGIQFRSDLSSPLTEAEAADLFEQFGVTLQADRPTSLLDRSKAEALVGTFGQTLAARSSGNAGSVSNPGNGNNTGSGTISLEQTLAECQNLPKVKDCHVCCKGLGTYSNKACAHACNNSPKASASEPTP